MAWHYRQRQRRFVDEKWAARASRPPFERIAKGNKRCTAINPPRERSFRAAATESREWTRERADRNGA
jgi:hypothetical protein